jgi:hypothetical protein
MILDSRAAITFPNYQDLYLSSVYEGSGYQELRNQRWEGKKSTCQFESHTVCPFIMR